ncbi:MAG: FtsX-like permease family protein [SAR202 cluster bacterium]|nr:FtsX-like permease family protein [SAR202 cluster bacterium]
MRSSVVLGVLLASAIMAGTVIYFDALRELALKRTLERHTVDQLNVILQVQRGPANYSEFRVVSDAVNEEIDSRIDWLVEERIRVGKSPTMFLNAAGNRPLTGYENPRTYFTYLPTLLEHAEILPGGRMPSDAALPSSDGTIRLEALVPEEAARTFGVNVGDEYVASPPWTDSTQYATVVITGVFRRADPNHEYWFLERSVLQSATGVSFTTMPFFVTEREYMEVVGPAFRRMDSTYAWLLTTDVGRINARNSVDTVNRLEFMQARLSSTLGSYLQTTELDNALSEYDRRLFFSKLPMYVVLILIAVVILYYVTTLSSLSVEDRRSEVALLRSRGASPTQILLVFVMEGATVAFLCSVVGPFLAAGAISVLGLTPAFSDLSGGFLLDAALSPGAFMMGAIGGILSFVALMVPAVQASRITVTRLRQGSARPTGQPVFQKYYLDVLLLLLGMFLFRQLTQQGSVVAASVFGELAVNQLLLIIPGLILIASAMVLLRLFPIAMNLASKVMSPWLPAGLVMGVWQMARNPTHYARLSLLLILTAGLGIFASSFGTTLERNFRERVLYSTGSDLRIEGNVPVAFRGQRGPKPTIPSSNAALIEAYESVPGVDKATVVLRASGHDLSKVYGMNYTMVSVEGNRFNEVAWFRDDFASGPLDELLPDLAVRTAFQGVALPPSARTLALLVKADRPHPGVRVTVRAKTNAGKYFTFDLGTLRTGNWTTLETTLGVGTPQLAETALPLTIMSIRVHETGGARRLQPGSILIDEIAVRSNTDAPLQTVETFDNTSGWLALKSADDAVADSARGSDITSTGEGTSLLFTWSEGSPLTTRGVFRADERPRLPVLASATFAKGTGHDAGDEFDVSVGGNRVPVRIEGAVELFPTMVVSSERYLVSDFDTLADFVGLGILGAELNPNEIWIASSTTREEREELIDQLESGLGFSTTGIMDRSARLAQTQVDPLVQAGWRSLLFIAFSAVLILSCLGFMVHAYVSFQSRQLQFALLQTLGFSSKQLITMVWLEQALVIGVGMALGTWMGGRLGATIMPFLGHDDWGSRVVPPFAMTVNWGLLLSTYAIMFAVFAVIILGMIWLIHRIQLQRILRLGEM